MEPGIHSWRPSGRDAAGVRRANGVDARHEPESLIRRSIRTFGEVLITLGLVVLMFAAYEVYGKAYQVNADQDRLNAQLDQQWAAGPTPGNSATPAEALPGQAVARLYIPKLDKKWVVVEGVDPDDIKLAPGHYPDSQMPNEVGNFAIAGHRMPSIFWDLDKLQNGDTIVLETQTDWYVYSVKKNFITLPTQVSVVSSNPENPGQKATAKMLTLTTCNPKWDNYERLIIWAEQTKAQPHSAGKPPEVQ
ncbi:class E sortase [Cryptosporangium arvum]|uniref:Sortase family protein, LPXTG-site transpeptidase n=1 Tax=Cryptosporangium arvum DSM 44712 TaxID=927661 RepID=A0A010YV28_9ACTN|nr:sortase family protein, LPXTG-site transpeptidase [Cryptosporangium arvum DSM 44712]